MGIRPNLRAPRLIPWDTKVKDRVNLLEWLSILEKNLTHVLVIFQCWLKFQAMPVTRFS